MSGPEVAGFNSRIRKMLTKLDFYFRRLAAGYFGFTFLIN
jgi:hypothetical protein